MVEEESYDYDISKNSRRRTPVRDLGSKAQKTIPDSGHQRTTVQGSGYRVSQFEPHSP